MTNIEQNLPIPASDIPLDGMPESALGQKRKRCPLIVMSALTQKTDICRRYEIDFSGEVPSETRRARTKISQAKRSRTHAENDLDPSVFVNQLNKPIQR